MPPFISPQQIVTRPCDHCKEVTTFIRRTGSGAYKFYENVCEPCRAMIDVKKQRAMAEISKAIKEGRIHRPDKCELCGKVPSPIAKKQNGILAHHAYGYDHFLRVWWLCHQCNQKLKGYKYHSGQVTKDEARAILGLKVDDETSGVG